MYERTTKQTRKAAHAAADENNNGQRTVCDSDSANMDDQGEQAPGDRLREVIGEEKAAAVNATLKRGNKEEDTIREIANNDLGLQYYPVSECNTLGSAFCALFWDPSSSFIIVSFKGTTPTDFMEWRSDFTFQRILANHCVTGFSRGKAHSIRLSLPSHHCLLYIF